MGLFKKIFFDNISMSNGIEYIIAGLGNPGDKYSKTRHNAGFIALDQIASRFGQSFKKSNFEAESAIVNINGKKALLIKPMTYMNESGRAILKAMEYYKVCIENVVVIFDDITLDIGRIRIKRNGSHGGHNGIKSIINLCG